MSAFSVVVLLLGAISLSASAKPQWVRWTGAEDPKANLVHVLDVIRQKTGVALSPLDYILVEDRKLATSHFTMLQQVSAKIPIKSQTLRIWTSLKTDETIQIEALVDTAPSTPQKSLAILNQGAELASQWTMAYVHQIVAAHPDDPAVRSVDWKDYWENDQLVRAVKVKGRHGTHEITLSLKTGKVLSKIYVEFPQAGGTSEFSIPVRVFPIYEEVEGTGKVLPRTTSDLRYLLREIRTSTVDPYLELRKSRYLDAKIDPFLGLSVDGRSKGFWAMSYIREQADSILSRLPLGRNDFGGNNVYLEGRYASVNLHPEAKIFNSKIDFTPKLSVNFRPAWIATPEDKNVEEMIPGGSLYGRPLTTSAEAWNRVARRLKNHDPATYLNDGFDELQVYWAINQMFDSLRGMGFTDPELSTRRFHAFLYDPDIAYRDNAYYTDDTINFTTYSSNKHNMARDNTTIWHELGHGVMDRLMGDYIKLADTGGLSEGMADFVAQLVVNDIAFGDPFEGKLGMRIFNNTGFHLTNEVHDDGESYGGSMNDLLVAAMKKFGRAGLTKVSDLTMEAMRLTRNHPALTANEWFSHMLFADALGSRVRARGELKDMITDALNGRNFQADGSKAAKFTLMNGTTEVTSNGKGSRTEPLVVKLKEDERVIYDLKVKLLSATTYQFQYPVTVKVQFRGGPIQGAVHWDGEERGTQSYQIASEADELTLPVKAYGKCDEVNRPDGSCVDFAYIQIFNRGETEKPQAKKRFYLRITK